MRKILPTGKLRLLRPLPLPPFGNARILKAPVLETKQHFLAQFVLYVEQKLLL